MRLRPIVQFKHHNAGQRIKHKQSGEHSGAGALKASITGDHDGMRPLKLFRVAWVDEAHGTSSSIRTIRALASRKAATKRAKPPTRIDLSLAAQWF